MKINKTWNPREKFIARTILLESIDRDPKIKASKVASKVILKYFIIMRLSKFPLYIATTINHDNTVYEAVMTGRFDIII